MTLDSGHSHQTETPAVVWIEDEASKPFEPHDWNRFLRDTRKTGITHTQPGSLGKTNMLALMATNTIGDGGRVFVCGPIAECLNHIRGVVECADLSRLVRDMEALHAQLRTRPREEQLPVLVVAHVATRQHRDRLAALADSDTKMSVKIIDEAA